MKIISLDIGTKRIGLALAEEKITSTYGVIKMTDLTKTISEISQIIRSEGAEKVIIGIPKSRDTLQADKIHRFAIELAKIVNLPIDYVDESLTSKEAERQLKDTGLDPRSEKYKEEVDKISAKLILEQYVNHSNS